MSKKTSLIIDIIVIAIFVVGIGLISYPYVSDWWNSLHQSKAISGYSQAVDKLSQEEYDSILDDAAKYNEDLRYMSQDYIESDDRYKRYNSLLNLYDSGMMGYIEIPSIDCKLPIYHGTSETVLQVAVGHLDWSSLPVGGSGTHCILSGHTGLPSATLFTDIRLMVEGDVFMIHVLDETLYYKVDQIQTVLPEEVSSLNIENGKDYCTLVTCTPYGVNTHRLLVRGVRVDYEASPVRITSDAVQVDEIIVFPVVAIPMLVVLFTVVLTGYIRRKRKNRGV